MNKQSKEFWAKPNRSNRKKRHKQILQNYTVLNLLARADEN